MSVVELEWGKTKPEVRDSIYAVLQSGDNVFRVVSNAHKFFVHWEKDPEGNNKRIICPSELCPICKNGKAPRKNYGFLVLWDNSTNGSTELPDRMLQVLTVGASVFGKIDEFARNPDWGSPNNYDIKVLKEGSGMTTSYSTIPRPLHVCSKFTKTEKDRIKASDLNLNEIFRPSTIDEINTILGISAKVVSSNEPEDIEDLFGD